MSLEKLSKQLKRELKANPQKAGMLGLLCAVAAYFWGPLVFKSEEPKKVATVAAQTATTTTATSPILPATPVAAGKDRMEWRELSSRLQSDPLMKSVAGKSATDEARNPFDAPTIKEEVTPDDDELLALLEEAEAAGMLEEKKPTITREMTSAALNAYPLTLSSTLVGRRSRTAIINGKAYPQGKAIGKINEVELVLEFVDPRSATIAWNGARRELRIPKPGENADESLEDAKPDTKTDAEKVEKRGTDDSDRNERESSAEFGDYLKSRAAENDDDRR